MSADLSMAGHEVNLYELPRFKETIIPIKEKGGIEIIAKDPYGVEFTAPGGGKTGFAKFKGKVTTDMKEAVKGVELIMFVIPAFGQRVFLEELAPHLEDGQVIVFNPGNFGALECIKILKEKGMERDVVIAETECLVYACRRSGPAQVWIMNFKQKVKFAALPAKNTMKALKVANEVFPQFVPATNVLDTSINNINFVIHPASVLLNVVKTEMLGAYKYSHYDATPSVARVMEVIDGEKMAIAKALGLEPISTKDILRRYYGAKGENLYEVLCDCKTYKTQTAPDNLRHRYITEDVPYGLVPLASLGDLLNVSTHTIKALIQIASVVNQTDYWREGRTVKKLGLAGLKAEQIIKLVAEGK